MILVSQDLKNLRRQICRPGLRVDGHSDEWFFLLFVLCNGLDFAFLSNIILPKNPNLGSRLMPSLLAGLFRLGNFVCD